MSENCEEYSMVRQVLGKKKVVYSEGDQIRAIRGFVTVQDDFIIVKSNNNIDPIWIGKSAVLTIKNLV
jgi:hypothetical protein